MSFLRRLFAGRDEGAYDAVAAMGQDERQCVTVWIRLFDAEFANETEQMRVFALEDRLMKAVDTSGAGTFDTNDLERGSLGMHFLGPDADAMLEVIRPLLVDAPEGSYLAVRRGPAGTSEERMEPA